MQQIEIPDRSLILGVDPGYKGALALYDMHSQTLVSVTDMPVKMYTLSSGKRRHEIDKQELAWFLDLNRDLIRAAIIEEVGAMPGDGGVGLFNFGFSTGVVHGMIAANLIPITTVKPTVWKINMGLSNSKIISLQKAQALFPSHHTSFIRKKDDGRAEAALLAKYGERIFGNSKLKSLI